MYFHVQKSDLKHSTENICVIFHNPHIQLLIQLPYLARLQLVVQCLCQFLEWHVYSQPSFPYEMQLPNLIRKPLFFLGLHIFLNQDLDLWCFNIFLSLTLHLATQAKESCTRFLSKWKISNCPGKPSRRPAGSSAPVNNHPFLIESKKMTKQN